MLQRLCNIRVLTQRLLGRQFSSAGGIVASNDNDDVLLSRSNDGMFATVTLNRPKLHNAFSDAVCDRLLDIVAELRADAASDGGNLRGLFFRANGKSFCAGADLEYMKRAATYSYEQNLADAERVSELFHGLSTLPLPVVALVQGGAFGGGIGIISCCDVAIAVENTAFALSEVKLGLLPATISPFVVARIGQSAARRYFLTAETFNAVEAQRIGLVHEIVSDRDGLDEWEARLRKALRGSSPTAVAASKALVEAVAYEDVTEALRHDTAVRLCEQRANSEATEGVAAFLEKRKPVYSV
eukprot:g23.t1